MVTLNRYGESNGSTQTSLKQVQNRDFNGVAWKV